MSDPNERIDRWLERADRGADRMSMEDVVRHAELSKLNPPEQAEALAALADGELVFLLDTLGRVGELTAWGLETGRIKVVDEQGEPVPDARLVLTAEVLAGVGDFRRLVAQEAVRRALDEDV